jgi:hypothetical protein
MAAVTAKAELAEINLAKSKTVSSTSAICNIPEPKQMIEISLIAMPTTIPIAVCKILRGLASLEKPSDVMQTVIASKGASCCKT